MAKTDYKAISNKTWEFSKSMRITQCLTKSSGCCDVFIAHIIISFSSQCFCGDKQSLLFHRFLTAWQLLDEKVWVFLFKSSFPPIACRLSSWGSWFHLESPSPRGHGGPRCEHVSGTACWYFYGGRNDGSEKQLDWKRQHWHWKLSFPIKMQIWLSTCKFTSRQNISFSVSRP